MGNRLYPKDLDKLIKEGQIEPALYKLVTFFKQLQDNQGLLTPEYLSEFGRQAIKIRDDQNALNKLKAVIGADSSECLRKELTACIEALFEVEKFNRGLTGKQARMGGAQKKQFYRVLQKKLGRSGLPFGAAVLEGAIKKIGFGPETEKDLKEAAKDPSKFMDELKKVLYTTHPEWKKQLNDSFEQFERLLLNPDKSLIRDTAAISDTALTVLMILQAIFTISLIVASFNVVLFESALVLGESSLPEWVVILLVLGSLGVAGYQFYKWFSD